MSTFSDALGTVSFVLMAAVPSDAHLRRGAVIWLTGLPGAGKSTLATALGRRLPGEVSVEVVVLDGDVVRKGLCSDLGFSREDRAENVRRVAEVAGLFAGAGIVCVAALISPFAADRSSARSIVGQRSAAPFFEVFVDAPLHCCQERDPKGLYRSARSGAIASFTGVSGVYEPPTSPDIVVQTHLTPVDVCADLVIAHVSRVLGPGQIQKRG